MLLDLKGITILSIICLNEVKGWIENIYIEHI